MIFGKIPDEQRVQARAALPGIKPVGRADWITVDKSYAAQIAYKQRLLREKGAEVYDVLPSAQMAAEELLQEVLALLAERPDFAVTETDIHTPDNRVVAVHGAAPLIVLSQVLQEDLCIHLKVGDVHHLMGALLCFPASWTLAQKIGKPLVGVHATVPEYDETIARRVQRLFDGVQVGLPIWRANLLPYDDANLYQPRTEGNPRPVGNADSPYERTERQTLFRLPQSRAVVFAIHTIVANNIEG